MQCQRIPTAGHAHTQHTGNRNSRNRGDCAGSFPLDCNRAACRGGGDALTYARTRKREPASGRPGPIDAPNDRTSAHGPIDTSNTHTRTRGSIDAHTGAHKHADAKPRTNKHTLTHSYINQYAAAHGYPDKYSYTEPHGGSSP